VKLIDRFNEYIDNECSSMPHGGFISFEHLEAATLRASIYAFTRKYNLKECIPVEELKELADLIEKQGDRTVQEVSEAHRRRDPDAL
jgi:hypothetical protein